MKRIVKRNSTQLRIVPKGRVVRLLLKNEVVESTGKTKQFNKRTWIEVRVLHGPIITGYVLKDDTEKLS